MANTSSTNRDIMLQAAGDIEAFVIAGATELAATIADLNNGGGGQAVRAPIDTGQLRGSIRTTINQVSTEQGEARPKHGGSYPLTSGREVRRAVQLGGMKLGDTIWERWIAPYGNLIENPGVGDDGRPYGSPQAPDGWVWTCIDEGISRLDRWRYQP